MCESIEQIYNFFQLSDRIATAGQPTIEQYPAIVTAGYQIVINLAVKNSSNALVDEDSIATNLGLKYIHIPVQWTAPTLADFQEFTSVMDAHIDKKIFIHCAANKRVSAFMYLYRIHHGVAESNARQDLAKIWIPDPIWQNFIDAVGNDCDRI